MISVKAFSEAPRSAPDRLRLMSVLFVLALLGMIGCMENEPVERYVDLKLPDSLYAMAELGDSVHIEWDSTLNHRVQSWIWKGEQLDSNQLKRLPAPEYYDGGFALLSLTLFVQDSVEKIFSLRYEGDGKGLKIRQTFMRIKIPPPVFFKLKTPDSLFAVADSADSATLVLDSIPTGPVLSPIWQGKALDTNQLLHLPAPSAYRNGIAHFTLTFWVKDSVEQKFALKYNSVGDSLVVTRLFKRIKIPPPPLLDTLLTIKDANLDSPPHIVRDKGRTPILSLDPTGIPQNDVFAFNLDSVKQGTLKKATLLLRTFAWPYTWSTDSVTLQIRIRVVTSAWKEGTGNWYWHDGGFRNGGDNLLLNYASDPTYRGISTNPSDLSKINPLDTLIFQPHRLQSVAQFVIKTRYTNSNPRQIPNPTELVSLELDVTDYMKSGDLITNFGFFIPVIMRNEQYVGSSV